MAGFGGWLRRLFGDSEKECPTASVLPGRVRSEGHKSFAEANNEFALAMYGQLRARLGKVFFSPFSIRTALAMAHAGARGKTAHQMVGVLRISMSDERLPVTFRTMLQQLNADGGTQYELAVANSLWGQDGVQLQAEYLDLISDHYGGEMKLVDFRRSVDEARATINQWVEGKTNRRILELIPSGGLSADTRLVLVNAVYFKGKWVLQFHKELTLDAPFRLQGGGTVRAPLMHQQDCVRYLQPRTIRRWTWTTKAATPPCL